MPKITFTVPQIAKDRKFFVRAERLEGMQDFRGPALWRNKFTEGGHTHALRIRADERGVLDLMAFPYTSHEDRDFVRVNFDDPLTVIFVSMEYTPEEVLNAINCNKGDTVL